MAKFSVCQKEMSKPSRQDKEHIGYTGKQEFEKFVCDEKKPILKDMYCNSELISLCRKSSSRVISKLIPDNDKPKICFKYLV
jgi:hypothetical protein